MSMSSHFRTSRSGAPEGGGLSVGMPGSCPRRKIRAPTATAAGRTTKHHPDQVPRPAPAAAPPAILFDLDGTLLDSIELILSSARYAFGKLGRECPSDAEWLQGVGIPLFTMFGRYARDDADRVALIAAYR